MPLAGQGILWDFRYSDDVDTLLVSVNCRESLQMKLGFAGLGRMGANMVRRLRRGDIEVVAWNRSPDVTRDLAQECGAGFAGDRT